MKTPITPLRMPLDLKARVKKRAAIEDKSLSAWIFENLEKTLDIKELIDKYIN